MSDEICEEIAREVWDTLNVLCDDKECMGEHLSWADADIEYRRNYMLLAKLALVVMQKQGLLRDDV